MKLYFALGGALLASVWATAACAQDAAPAATEATPAAQAAPAAIRVPMNTPVRFEFVTPLSSKTSKNDDFFPIRLIAPVEVAGEPVIPAGTMGQGQVIQSAKSGWGGKAGELVVTVRYLDFGGVHVPLRRFRMGELDTGTDRRDEAFGVSMAIPLAGFFMNGGEKTIVVGTHAYAIVSADTDIPAGAPAPAADAATTTTTTTTH